MQHVCDHSNWEAAVEEAVGPGDTRVVLTTDTIAPGLVHEISVL